MVVSNRNLLFQGSIFRGELLVSGRVLFLANLRCRQASGSDPGNRIRCWVFAPRLVKTVLVSKAPRIGKKNGYQVFHGYSMVITVYLYLHLIESSCGSCDSSGKFSCVNTFDF